MNPLENSQLLAQMNQQQPPQQPQQASPFSSGSLAAMDSIRNSLMSDDAQKRSALGMAISRFGAGMGNPANYERGGNGLGAAVASLGPATEAYDAQNNANRSENMNLIEYMRKLEHEQNEMARRKKEHEDTTAYHNAQLGETKRYHDLMYKEADNSEFEKKMQAGLIPKGSVPFSIMTNNEQSNTTKELRQASKEAEGLIGVGKVLTEMREQAKAYPDLYKSWNRILMSQSGKEPTMTDILGKKVVDPKMHAAYVKLKKLKSDLVKYEVNAAGSSKNQTDVMKQIYKDISPDADMPPEAFNYLVDRRLKEIEPGILYGVEAEKGLAGRYRPSRNLERTESPENASPETQIESHKQLGSELPSNAQSTIETVRTMIPEFANETDETILEWAKTPEAQKIISGA